MSSIPATAQHYPELPVPEYSGHGYAWEVATLFPQQGEWSEEEYLRLTDHANRRTEFTAASNRYSKPAEYGPEQIAISALLEGFGVDVGSLFAAIENIPE